MTQFSKPSAVFAAVMLAALAASSNAQAQPPAAAQPTSMPGMGTPMKPGGTAAGGSMMAAMDKMSKDMAAVPMTGDADRDFAGMMIPHHRGAIDMARYELAQGKDPAMRRLARAVVAAQEKEIGQMKAWQAAHPAIR